MTYFFVPDITNFEEEFAITAESVEEALQKLEEEFSYNCLLSMAMVTPGCYTFLGIVEVSEDAPPHFLEPFTENEKEYWQ